MHVVKLILIAFVLIFIPLSYALAVEGQDFPGVLKDRKVIGVIYFKKNSDKLSRTQLSELDRIISKFDRQSSADKILRIEGFSSNRSSRSKMTSDSLSRAKSVWYYLKKKRVVNDDALYLTAFGAQQKLSSLQGERVEIAVYANPFKEK